jgi:hypothetical protein
VVPGLLTGGHFDGALRRGALLVPPSVAMRLTAARVAACFATLVRVGRPWEGEDVGAGWL